MILFASSEIYPLAKTGGLGDVSGTLPKAIHSLGWDISLIMPHYKNIEGEYIADYPVTIGEKMEMCILKRTYIDDIPVYLMGNQRYFNRESLYGYGDDAERFLFFSLSVLECIKKGYISTDIIHCNDWQTGMLPLLLKHNGLNIKTVFTIHNLNYQGNFSPDVLSLAHLDNSYYTMDKIEFYGNVSFLKAGIIYSDAVTTVSPTYLKEIQTPAYGCRMDGVLRANKHKLHGILNGIDYSIWNPENDKIIPYHYGVNKISDKEKNKRELCRELKLNFDKPLLVMISRLTEQKGIDLLIPILKDIPDTNIVILGTGDETYHNQLNNMNEKNIRVILKFDEVLAHKLYAGGDFFLMPSRYEPCGLSQLIALKYGCVPIVRKTGGLADTVVDYSNKTNATGFVFDSPDSASLKECIERAIEVYHDSEKWKAIQVRGMRMDFSWKSSGEKYLRIYKKISQKVSKQV